MGKNAWISVAIFAVLLVLVVATREDKVSVGMRSLKLPTFEKDKVTLIEVSGKNKARLANDGAWTVADPEKPDVKFAVEQSLLDGALDALAELEATSFVTARAAKHDELELTDEKGVRVRIEQVAGPKLDLVFGRAAKGGGNYVRLSGSDEVFVGTGRFGSLIRKDASAWRKRDLVTAKLEDLVSINVEPKGSASYTIEAFEEGDGDDKKTGWRLQPGTPVPDGFVPDEAIIKRIASSLAGLRAADFAEGAGQGFAGDVPAAGRLTARLKDNSGIVVSFGDEDDKKRRFVTVEGDTQVYLVSTFTVNNLVKTKLELRDLTLARFEPATAERVVIKGESETVEIMKKEGVWTLTQPSTTPPGYEFDAAGVDGKLAALARVKATSRFDAPVAQSGLDKPSVSVSVSFADGSQKRIAFGAPVPKAEGEAEQFYVQGADDDMPYAIGKWQRDRYAKPLDVFKKVAPPPGPPGGGAGGIPGMENLPPDVREKLMKQLQQQGMPGR